jgi:hypothetical protein
VSKQIDAALRQIATAQADVRRRLTAASGGDTARLQTALTALQQAGAALAEIFDSIRPRMRSPCGWGRGATAALASGAAPLPR